MGRASREKLMRRMQAIESALSARAHMRSPWYESNLLWTMVNVFLAIILAVVPTLKRDLGWLFWVAWVFAGIAIWIVSKNFAKLLPTRFALFFLAVSAVGFGLYSFNKAFVESQRANESTSARLDEISRLLKNQSDAVNPQKLLAKYPLGYVIFELDYKNEVFPYQSRSILDSYVFDWSVVRFIKNTPDQIAIRLPDARLKDGTVAFTNAITGGKKQVGNLDGVSIGELIIWGEILAIRDKGIVFLVRFERRPQFLKP
jgi:hypothetical protein